jgi:hypothetical protein
MVSSRKNIIKRATALWSDVNMKNPNSGDEDLFLPSLVLG